MSIIDLDRVLECVEADELVGFCKECGEESEDCVEPDARGYKCTACGAMAVYGAEELVLWAF